MLLKYRTLPVIILGVFWGIVAITMVTGIWEAKLSAEEVTAADPADIKGWMTIEDVSQYFKIPPAELYTLFSLPKDTDLHKPLKDIAAGMGKETDDFREILAQHLSWGGSFTSGEYSHEK